MVFAPHPRLRFATLGAVCAFVGVGCGDQTSSSELLSGGPDAFRDRLVDLRGTPVVVNQWASWCGPCRTEFPFLKAQAIRRRGQVAFLGVNARDTSDDAARFLRSEPVPFPHFADPDARISRIFRGGRAWPTTAFYNGKGELVFTHQGAYRDEEALARDIERYAVDG